MINRGEGRGHVATGGEMAVVMPKKSSSEDGRWLMSGSRSRFGVVVSLPAECGSPFGGVTACLGAWATSYRRTGPPFPRARMEFYE